MTPNQYTPEEPISSIATALAPAALGIVRASGKNCIELVSKIFSRPKALLEAAGNTLVYGWIVDKGGESLPLAPAGKPSSATPSPRDSAPKTPFLSLRCHVIIIYFICNVIPAKAGI